MTFRNAVDNNQSYIFTSRIYVEVGNRYVESGHSVSVTGYASYTNHSNNTTAYFLRIADCWNSFPRYLIFKLNTFVSSHAAIIN